MPQPPRITVLGSLNMDISVTVPRLAGPGETVLGSAARLQPGGKGANQAVAAARLGASVRMAGCCGDDAFGGTLRSALEAAGVDITAVRVLAGVPSGLALITVDATGENSITVAPGANGQAGPPEAAASAAAPCDALVLSAEIPVPVLAAALDRARAGHVMTVLNLAPAPPDASGLLDMGVDWLIVNAPEAAAILGRPVAGPAAAQAAAADLAGSGAGHVVITLGSDGAVLAGPVLAGPVPAGPLLAGPGAALAVPGFSVPSVDSVGAGDAFVAALGVAVASGVTPPEAVRLASAVAATAVTRPGAQDGLPTAADVLAATGVRWPLG
ncbi:MAG TPA: ribokinase [Streptosporangiaceae bacterium]|nr:ribokinase [Streptosporangiaceae bacterium]